MSMDIIPPRIQPSRILLLPPMLFRRSERPVFIMVPVLAGYIGKSIADRPGFLVGLVGGYLATTGSTFASVAGYGDKRERFLLQCVL